MDMVERIKKLMESPEPEKVDPVVEVKNIKVRKNLPGNAPICQESPPVVSGCRFADVVPAFLLAFWPPCF